MTFLLVLLLTAGSYNIHFPAIFSGKIVCIDAGHGGQRDRGNQFYTGGCYGVISHQAEGDVNLRVARSLESMLVQSGCTVYMTRDNASRVTSSPLPSKEIDARVELAKAKKADILISIHHNSCNKPDINYTTSFFTGPYSRTLADYITSDVAANLSTSILYPTGTTYYRLLRTASNITPLTNVVLVEASFLSNPNEDKKLLKDSRINQEALGIYTGIKKFLWVEPLCAFFNTNFSTSRSSAPKSTHKNRVTSHHRKSKHHHRR